MGFIKSKMVLIKYSNLVYKIKPSNHKKLSESQEGSSANLECAWPLTLLLPLERVFLAKVINWPNGLWASRR